MPMNFLRKLPIPKETKEKYPVPEAAARRAEELTKRRAEAERALPPAPDGARLAVLAAEAALLDRELAGSGDPERLPEKADLQTAEELAERCAAAPCRDYLP